MVSKFLKVINPFKNITWRSYTVLFGQNILSALTIKVCHDYFFLEFKIILSHKNTDPQMIDF